MSFDSFDRRAESGRLVPFFALTFAVAWLLWLVSGVLGRATPRAVLDVRWFVAQVGVFAPALSALLLSAFESPAQRRNSLFILAAVFVPVSVLGLFVAGSAAAGPRNLGTVRAALVVLAGVGVVAFFAPFHRRVRNPGGHVALPGARGVWILAAFLGPLVLFGGAWLLVGGAAGPSRIAAPEGGGGWAVGAFALVWFFNLMFGGSLGEEIGWRGFALPLLLRRFSPLAASSILAVFWALWHLPLDLRYGFGFPGVGGILLRLVWTWALTVIFTWVYLRAGGGLLAPLLLHASINVLGDLGFSAFDAAMYVFYVLVLLLGLVGAVALARSGPVEFSENGRVSRGRDPARA